jgi:hypothetical protein
MKKYKHAIKWALALYKSLKNNPIAHSVWDRNPPRRRRNMTVIAWDGKILATDKMRPHGEGFFRFPRIPMERPSQAVFMWGGCRPCLHGRFSGKMLSG